MSWKSGPDFLQFLLGLLVMTISTAAGAVAKIAEDVKRGDRRKFWSRQLWLDLPAVVMMAIVAYSVAEYFELPLGIATSVGTVLGWAGPRIVDSFLGAKIREWGDKR